MMGKDRRRRRAHTRSSGQRTQSYRRSQRRCVNCAQGLQPLFLRIAECAGGGLSRLLCQPLEGGHHYAKCPYPLWGAGRAAAERHKRHVRHAELRALLARTAGATSGCGLLCTGGSTNGVAVSRCRRVGCPRPAGHHMTHDHDTAMLDPAGSRLRPPVEEVQRRRERLADATARAKIAAAREREEAAVRREKKAHRRRFAAIAWRVKRRRPKMVAELGEPPVGWGCAPIRRKPRPAQYKAMQTAYGWPVEAEFWSELKWRWAVVDAKDPVNAERRRRLFWDDHVGGDEHCMRFQWGYPWERVTLPMATDAGNYTL